MDSDFSDKGLELHQNSDQMELLLIQELFLNINVVLVITKKNMSHMTLNQKIPKDIGRINFTKLFFSTS